MFQILSEVYLGVVLGKSKIEDIWMRDKIIFLLYGFFTQNLKKLKRS